MSELEEARERWQRMIDEALEERDDVRDELFAALDLIDALRVEVVRWARECAALKAEIDRLKQKGQT